MVVVAAVVVALLLVLAAAVNSNGRYSQHIFQNTCKLFSV